MAYEFFISYSRGKDPYLQKFVDMLSDEIRDVRGVKPSIEVGFFDQREIELGEDWDATIVEALQSSSVFLPLYSPAFFKSPYCTKELSLFRQRCTASLAPGKPIPPLIKPIIWIPFDVKAAPPVVAAGQFTIGDPLSVHNESGVKFMFKQFVQYETQLNSLIRQLALQITAAADAHLLPRLAAVPKLQNVMVGGDGLPAPIPPSGPKHVRLVYVAADPQAFGAARGNGPYVESGGPDWKPFFPADKTRIHRFVQNVVSADDLDFTSDEMRFGDNLIAEIEDAWRQRQIVILVVDGWSVHWSPHYRALLSQLDGRLDYHWCVLVPSNELDVDANAIRTEIADTLASTFDRHARLSPNPMFYRAEIKSAEDLRKALHEVLIGLKEEIRGKASPQRPVPVGPPKSTLSGSSEKR